MLYMDGNRLYHHDGDAISNGEYDAANNISVEQLQRLVRLLDSSDVTEVEVKHGGEGPHKTRLVLRKAKASENNEQMVMVASTRSTGEAVRTAIEKKYPVTASLV